MPVFTDQATREVETCWVVGAIIGVAFLVALAKFGYDIVKNVINVAYLASGCLIRSIALVVFLYILYLVFARFVGG